MPANFGVHSVEESAVTPDRPILAIGVNMIDINFELTPMEFLSSGPDGHNGHNGPMAPSHLNDSMSPRVLDFLNMSDDDIDDDRNSSVTRSTSGDSFFSESNNLRDLDETTDYVHNDELNGENNEEIYDHEHSSEKCLYVAGHSVLTAVLKSGAVVFGGAARNELWKRFYEEKDNNDTEPQFTPISYWRRTGEFRDIDCIMTTEQFIELKPALQSCGKLYVHERLVYDKMTNAVNTFVQTEGIRMYNIVVRIEIPCLKLDRCVEIDAFVCSCAQVSWRLRYVIEDHVDYTCNAISMSMYENNRVIFQSLCHTLNDSQAWANLQNTMNYCFAIAPGNPAVSRILKMANNGWFAEVASFTDVNYTFRKMYLCVISKTKRCCDHCTSVINGRYSVDEDPEWGAYLYIRTGNNYMHLKCYQKCSIVCYEHLDKKDVSKGIVPNTDDCSWEDAELGFLSEEQQVTSSDANCVTSDSNDRTASDRTPIPCISTYDINDGISPSERAELDRFRTFTRIHHEREWAAERDLDYRMANQVVREVASNAISQENNPLIGNQEIEIIHDNVFINGIATAFSVNDLDPTRYYTNMATNYSLCVAENDMYIMGLLTRIYDEYMKSDM